MLPTTTEFDAAIDANTTEVDCRVEIEREFNAIADNISVSASLDPVDPRFHKDNVVNIRNPKFNGIAYAPMSEFFTSSVPLQGFRMIDNVDFDRDRSVAYYIPVATGGTNKADLTVDYAKDYETNCIEFRYENTRTQNTTYDNPFDIYVTPDGGSETLVHTTTMNSEGVTRIYWDGTDWTEVEADKVNEGVDIRSVRLVVRAGTYTHQPRVMYFGSLHIIDVSDDIIDVSVDKTEFEPSTYLPHGEPSGNTCDVTLDNTAMNYRFGSDVDRNYFLKNQRMTIKFGVNTKYGEGADSFEYVSGGVFYIDTYGYDEEQMTVSVNGQDFSKFLQETFCGNYLWIDKSIKYIVYDVLARSGISPRGVIFDFGVAGNADESNIRNFTWSTDEQTLWDFLSDLAKSELGTVFYDEEENLVITDRLDMNDKVTQGVQYTFDADVNLESIEEKFEVGANKIKVNYEDLELNSTKANPQLVTDRNNQPRYESGPEIPLNQALWQPGDDEGYLGSATLSRTLKPGHNYLYVSRDTGVQITREEGEVLVGDEFIRYKDRTKVNSGEVRLRVVERDARNTVYNGVIPTHLGWQAMPKMRKRTFFPRSLFSTPVAARRRMTEDGFRQYLRTAQDRYRNVVYPTELGENVWYTSNYRIYGARFRFNKLPKGRKSDQAAGIFLNMNKSGRAIFLEISNPSRDEFVNENGFKHATGNVRAYKINSAMGPVALPPDPKDNAEGFGTNILFDEAVSGVGGHDGTYIDITAIQVEETGPDRILWYVNGEFIGQFRTEYGYNYLRNLGYTAHESKNGNSICQKGRFGVFTRGSTDATFDFLYASNDNSIGPDELLQTKGFNKYFDSHTNSWNVKRDYLKGREHYLEFGAPVHEVTEFEVDHDTYPNVYSRVLNTDEATVSVFKESHDPFSSRLVVGNTARIGVDLNNTVFYPDGTKLDHSFLVYGLGVIRAEEDNVVTSDSAAIRRYGVEEVEFDNPWVNSKSQAISLASHIRKFWSKPQQFFELEVMPSPALQVRDRVNVLYNDKGFDGSSVWFVNGINITYDGGLSSSVVLKRYEDYPTEDVDYRDTGGIEI